MGRFFGDKGPYRPHLTRAGGQGKEFADLRRDLADSFARVETEFVQGFFGTQAAWYIDPDNGSDSTGDGSVAAPFATGRAAGQRLSREEVQQPTLVKFLGDMEDDDEFNVLGSSMSLGATLEVEGTLLDTLSGTIVTVTPNATTSEAPWELETSGVTWTSTNNRRIQLPGGQVGYVYQVVDANNVKVGRFQLEGSVDGFTPTTGAFTVSRASVLPRMTLDVKPAQMNPFFFSTALDSTRIRDLDLADDTSQSCCHFYSASLFGCRVATSRCVFVSDGVYRCCWRDCDNGQEFSAYDHFGQYGLFDGGIITSIGVDNAWIAQAPFLFIRNKPIMYRSGLFLDNPSRVNVFTEGLHCEEFLFDAINFFGTTAVLLNGEVSGSSSRGAGVGINVSSTINVAYNAANKPSITGPGGAALIGGTLRATTGDIPFINTTKLASLIEN